MLIRCSGTSSIGPWFSVGVLIAVWKLVIGSVYNTDILSLISSLNLKMSCLRGACFFSFPLFYIRNGFRLNFNYLNSLHCRLNDLRSIPSSRRCFSFGHNIQVGPGAYPDTYVMANGSKRPEREACDLSYVLILQHFYFYYTLKVGTKIKVRHVGAFVGGKGR